MFNNHIMETLIAITGMVLYLTSAALQGIKLTRKHTASLSLAGVLALVTGSLAIILHAILLYSWVMTQWGQNLAFFNMLSLVTWGIALLILLAALRHPLTSPVASTSVILFPIAALTIWLDLSFPGQMLIDVTQTPAQLLHIVLSIVAVSLLGLAALLALLLAIQDTLLRRYPHTVSALPPLQTLERSLFQLISSGFVALTLSLLTGFAFLDNLFAQSLVHKTTLSLVAWVVFAVLLWGRYRIGWRSTTAIRWTLTGFALLVLAYFGSKLVIELILQRA